jgi:hypothetical protein
MPLNYNAKGAPSLTDAEISMIWSLPEFMINSITVGIAELNPRNQDDTLPAYRMCKIPGTLLYFKEYLLISDYKESMPQALYLICQFNNREYMHNPKKHETK